MSEKITVFDIEILNQDPTSICAIGIVELVNNKVHSTYYSLIKPRNLSFDVYRYKVHKIKSKSLIHERTFAEVWQDISHYFQDHIVVAHDIQGDMMHIRAALRRNHIPFPDLKMSCTNVLAHLIYPKLQKYNLTELSKMNGIEFEAHHALEDAKATSLLLLKMLEQTNCQTLKDLHYFFHLDFGEMHYNYYRNIISPEMAYQLLESNQKEDALLYHQSICFTGKLSMPKEILEEKTKQVSAMPTHQVSYQTNYLVIGKNGYHKVRFGNENKKVKKALQLMKQGQDLKIVHENEYLRLLDKKR